MLDEAEFARVAVALRSAAAGAGGSLEARFRPALDVYYALTGFNETNINAVLHHRLSLYGPPCAACGKPLRSPRAQFCAACGHAVKNRAPAV